MKNCLVMTVGLPRSGKTTWCKKQPWPIVCPDAIRLALLGRRFYAPAEPVVWATAKLMVRSLFGAGHHTVVLDATNTVYDRRREWECPEWDVRLVPFDTSVHVCIARAEETYPDLVPVIKRMVAALDLPRPDERLLEPRPD